MSSRLKTRLLGKVTREERGAELVEAAIVLPVLLTLLIGIIWIGRAYNVNETITRAAREGARFAAAPSCALCGNTFPTDPEVINVINGALTASSLDPTPTTSVNPPISVCSNDQSRPSCTLPKPPGCQDAMTGLPTYCLDPNDPPADQLKGVFVTFGYRFTFVIPFTSLNLTTVTLNARVQIRQEL